VRRSGAIVLLVLAALLALTWVVLLLWDAGALPDALLGGSLTGAILAFAGFHVHALRARPAAVRASPDLSVGAVVLAFGVTALIVGAEVGPWLLLIGAAVTAGSLAQLAREHAAARAAVTAAATRRAQ
jgi:hypothetical protein